MSESVLERSVLERKERDELQSIARAMGAQPTARTKKADLVDLILRTAGVIPAEPAATEPAAVEGNGATVAAEAKPRRRTRSSSSSRANGVEQSANGSTTEGQADGGAATLFSSSPPTPPSSDSDSTGDDKSEQASTAGGEGPHSGEDSGDEAASVASAPEGDPTEHDSGRSGNGTSGDDSGGRQGRGRGERDRGDRGRGARGDNRFEGRGEGNDMGDGNRRRRRRGRDRGPGQNQGAGQGQTPNQGQGQGSETRAEEAWTGEPVACSGLLDLRDEGYGFLRTKGYLASKDDIYVSVKQVRQFGLRKGDLLTGTSRPANRTEKNPALLRVDLVNGKDPEEARRRPRFEDLTPLFPDEQLKLETPSDPTNMTARIVDLVSPIGKGQRGLIVSPPKAGKTTIMKQIVKSIEANNPDVHLMVLLVDERPEEVTDMRRSTGGEVIASTFDRPSDEHTQVTELGIERAKRLVEEGIDVVIVLDGITRLARAYNLAAPATGRIMSGGIDTGALYPPKKFFGAARNIEEGGSLTILATALIETGSKMDEVIFEEFKGTGNMELRLDRRLAERRIYPAIDVDASSTRHEELLFDRKQLQQVWRVRRALNALSADGASPSAALERLMDGMRTFASNEQFLAEAAKAGGPAT
jgi:transcription termination factor Rho